MFGFFSLVAGGKIGNSHGMIPRKLTVLSWIACCWSGQLSAEPQLVAPREAKSAEVVEAQAFTLQSVIAPVLKDMAEPKMRAKVVGEQLAISSPSAKAREHVKQGFALVHAQWDFEAYRHFCVALREDPDCLMAYCGVSLALARPHNEYVAYRRAAVDRMLDLLEYDEALEKEGKPGRFLAVEKDFSAAVATLVSTSPRTAGAMFHKIGMNYPNFIQAQLLALFLARGGYDLVGDATAGQIQAIKRTRAVLAEHPENPMVIGFWLALNAEAPLRALNFEKDLLPYARQLVAMDPGFAPWQQTLGHYALRLGDYAGAERAFAQSAKLYAEWMQDEGVSVQDCEGYLKAMECRAYALYQSGRFETALKVAKELRGLKLDSSRPRAAGNTMLMWRGYNLEARLYLARGAAGDHDKALKSLPGAAELAAFAGHKKYPSLAGVYNDALSMYAGCRKAIEKGDIQAAAGLRSGVFRQHIMNLAAVAKGATQVSDYSHYLRAGNSLAIWDRELGGLIALHGAKKTQVVAAGRFLSARDKQLTPSMMVAPLVLTPMDNRLGQYYEKAGDFAKAEGAYRDGAQRVPGNAGSLEGLKRCLEQAGKREQAAELQARLDALKAG